MSCLQPALHNVGIFSIAVLIPTGCSKRESTVPSDKQCPDLTGGGMEEQEEPELGSPVSASLQLPGYRGSVQPMAPALRLPVPRFHLAVPTQALVQ